MSETTRPRLTVAITRVRYRESDVRDGSIPHSAYENAVRETVECRGWADAVRALESEGATEWSEYPVPLSPRHGWFSNPDGAVEIHGGDQYDPGYDREEVSARLSGPGAFRAWWEVTRGTAAANMFRRSAHPVLGGSIADGWDGGDPWGSALAAGFAVCSVLYALDPNAVPAELEFSPGAAASQTLDELTEDEDYLTADIAQDTLAGRVTEQDLVSAARILSRYFGLVPESMRY